MPLKISAFPKCFLDDIAGDRTMSVFDWIEMARGLDADGLEMYDGFFTSLEDAHIDSVRDAIGSAGFAMPMLCCSPDFTNPDADARKRAVERECELSAWPGGSGAWAPSAACSPASDTRGLTVAGPGMGRRLHRGASCRSPASRTSSSASKTTTRTASGPIPNSLRRGTSSWSW